MLVSLTALAQQNPAQRGLELFRQGKYEAALSQFRSAARTQPGNALLENLIGITETKLGRVEQANADYVKAIRLNPAFAAAHKNLGFNYLNAGDPGRAEAELRKAVELDESDPFAHYYLAMTDLKASNDSDAIAQLEPARTLIENDPDTAFLMAAACLRANASNEAKQLIDAMDQRSAFTVNQEFQLAALMNAKQMYGESIHLFEHMAKAQPGSWAAQYDLAVALFDANRLAEAAPLLERLAIVRPNDGRILNLLGSVYEAEKKLPAALDAYQRAVAADPTNSDDYLDYTRLLIDLDRYDDAAALIEKGIRNSDDAYAMEIRLGAIDLMRGETAKGTECFQKAVAEHPEVAIGYVALAKAYMKDGKNEAAADLLSQARRKVPMDFALEYVFGLVSEQLGGSADAIAAFKNAEHLDPVVVEPHYQLGKLYMTAGQWELARTELETALSLAPSRAQSRSQLSKVYARLGDTQKAHEMQTEASRLMNAERDAALAAQRERMSAFQPQ